MAFILRLTMTKTKEKWKKSFYKIKKKR